MIRALPLLALVLSVACRTPATTETSTTTTTTDTAATSAQAEPAVKPVPATLPDVIARVNGEAITKAEFENAVREIEARAGEAVPADQRDRILRGVLDELVAFKLLLQETRTRNITVPDSEVDAQLATIRSQFPTDAAFTEALGQRGTTREELRADIRDDMTVAKMLEAQLGPQQPVTLQQLSDFYQSNPDQFQQPERVRASHILIRVPENADAAAKTQARTRATDVLTQVKAGKDFAGLAKQYSEDPASAANGGDLGYFNRGDMVGPFDQAAFSLQPAQTSELIETTFGFHIIRVMEKQAPRTVLLDEVRPQLEEFLKTQIRQEQMQSFVESLKTKGKLEFFI